MTHRQQAIYNLGVAIGHLNNGRDYESLAQAEFHVALALLEMTRADPQRIACDMLIATLEREKQRRLDAGQ
jgi:hypothetical protein